MKNYQDFELIIQKLRDRNMTQLKYYANYILSPYIKEGLEYDIYDIDFTDMLDDGVTYRFTNPQTDDGVKIYVSLKDSYNRYKEDDDRVWLHIDVDRNEMSLYFRVFSEWHKVSTCQFFAEGDDARKEAEDEFANISQIVYSSEFKSRYTELGEKYFTSVVLDNLVAQGDVLNMFVRRALIDELSNPSDILVDLLAELLKEYSTQQGSWLRDKLQPIKEVSALPLLDQALVNGELELSSVPKPSPKPVSRARQNAFMKPTRQVVEEPAPKEITNLGELTKDDEVNLVDELLGEDDLGITKDEPVVDLDDVGVVSDTSTELGVDDETVDLTDLGVDDESIGSKEEVVEDPFEAAGFTFPKDDDKYVDENGVSRTSDGTVDLSDILG